MSDFFSEYRKHEDIIKERIKKAPTKELLPFFNNVITTTSNAKTGVNRLANEDLLALSDYLGVNPDYFSHFTKIQKNLSKWILEEKNASDKLNYITGILNVSRKVVKLRMEKPSSWKLDELELIYNSMKNSFYQIFLAQE
jgi:hypothetical protein